MKFSILTLALLLGFASIPSAAAPAQLPPKLEYPGLLSLMAEPRSALLLLDVRTPEEYAVGHIPGSVLAPYDSLERSFKEADRSRPLVVYCRSGRRSAIAAATLKRMGYTNVSDFGALDKWRGGLAR